MPAIRPPATPDQGWRLHASAAEYIAATLWVCDGRGPALVGVAGIGQQGERDCLMLVQAEQASPDRLPRSGVLVGGTDAALETACTAKVTANGLTGGDTKQHCLTLAIAFFLAGKPFLTCGGTG